MNENFKFLEKIKKKLKHTQTLREIVESRRTLVASLTSIVVLAQTRARALVAHLTDRAHVALAQLAHTLAEIPIRAHVTSHARVPRSTYTLAGLFVTVVVERTLTVAIARSTIRKTEISLHTLVAIWSQIAELAVARRVAFLIRSTVDVTVAFAACGPIRVAIRAFLTLVARVLRLALAFASQRRTVTRRVRVVTVASATRVHRANRHSERTIVAGLALVTVNALCVVLAILAHSTA